MKRIKKILIVVLLFVVTLNINYLGMIGKRIIVESSEYKAGNTNNLVLNKILSDNELKTEIPKMFNYASNGNYYDLSSHKELNDSNYITSGLYSSSDEDGITYYYRGDIDNNNLVFGTYDEDYYVYGSGKRYYQTKESCIGAGVSEEDCQPMKIASKGEKMYWKIVRVNGDGSLRLIYNNCVNITTGEISHMSSVDTLLCGVGSTPYNLEINDPKYSGYTYDNGTDSFIKKEVDTWYNNTLGSNSLYDSKVILGRYCSDSSKFLEQEGNIAFSSMDRLGQYTNDFAKDNAPSFICPETTESYGGSYRLKAGLITADELAYAGESYAVTGNSYLNTGTDVIPYWSMTPLLFSSNISTVWSFDISFLLVQTVNSDYAVRPVINLTTENMTLTGEGTIDNPYILEEVEPTNSYKGKVTIEVGSSIEDIKAFEEELDLSGVTWTVKDSSIAKIENGKIIGLKNGTTVITGVGSDGTSYEIEVTVISNPVTSSVLYIGIGLILILVLGTGTYIYYRVKRLD